MSLIINADSEYLEGSGFSGGTNLTECTLAIWVKRDSGSSTIQSYCAVGPDFGDNSNVLSVAHNGISADCWLFPGNSQYRIDATGTTNSTSWQILILTYKKDVENIVSTGIVGGSINHTTGSQVSSETLNELIDSIRIGLGGYNINTWYARAKLAHCAFWDIALSSTQKGELFNGGTAGAGKNPQAVAGTNLKFYAPLTSDATVTIGGISLSETGTITYDGAENPNVESYSTSTNVTMANVTQANTVTAAAIYSSSTGTLTTAPLKNNAGTLLANETGATAYIHNVSTGALVVAKTGQTTNGSGVMTVTDALIVPSTQYRIVVKLASTAEGLDKLTAT